MQEFEKISKHNPVRNTGRSGKKAIKEELACERRKAPSQLFSDKSMRRENDGLSNGE
jgi:hypothetical protein